MERALRINYKEAPGISWCNGSSVPLLLWKQLRQTYSWKLIKLDTYNGCMYIILYVYYIPIKLMWGEKVLCREATCLDSSSVFPLGTWYLAAWRKWPRERCSIRIQPYLGEYMELAGCLHKCVVKAIVSNNVTKCLLNAEITKSFPVGYMQTQSGAPFALYNLN